VGSGSSAVVVQSGTSAGAPATAAALGVRFFAGGLAVASGDVRAPAAAGAGKATCEAPAPRGRGLVIAGLPALACPPVVAAVPAGAPSPGGVTGFRPGWRDQPVQNSGSPLATRVPFTQSRATPEVVSEKR